MASAYLQGEKKAQAYMRSTASSSLVLFAIAGLCSAITLGLSAVSAIAQGPELSWWDLFTGNGPGWGYGKQASDEDPRKKSELPNDLRPNATPFRSEAMIDALEAAIQRYQAIATAGDWPLIPGTRMIRPEDDDERVPVLRQRLMASGELARRPSYGFGFDSEDSDLDAAVRRFQENHGLRVTGRVDKPTLQELNVPAHARLAQLRLNLQRIRELMAQRIEERYVLVNIPAFELEAVDRHQVEQRHRVIAGKPDRQTPVVKATIRALNFFPYWRVPESVAALDLIPRLLKEPEYLQKEQIRVFNGAYNGPELDPTNIDWRQVDPTRVKFRQDPGDRNALGLVRIDMPNEYGVYMHDTPMKPLFNQRGRAFSAGCVRVQDVFKLVEWIARYEVGWDRPGRVEEIIATGQPLDLTLTHPVPVYFTYISAWAEPDGHLQFRPDIYGRDGVRELAARERDESEGPAPAQHLAP
jgi:murein L,D-transpeptidase YcbB/YkuD